MFHHRNFVPVGLLYTILYTWLTRIILLAGDISENPGPDTESSSLSTNDTLDTKENSLNVQGLYKILKRLVRYLHFSFFI